MDKPEDQNRAQLDFYADIAQRHTDAPFGHGEADFALPFLIGQIQMRGWTSLLDVGCGSGRLLSMIDRTVRLQRLVGLEPSPDLRALAARDYGLGPDRVVAGDAVQLSYADNEFDVVSEFAVLHHVRQPRQALSEMIRVARHAVLVVDSNNFGQGGWLARRCKQAARHLGLWNALDRLRTGGKGYHLSEGDGLYYSYSVFSDIDLLRDAFATVHVTNSTGFSVDHYRDAPGVLVLALDKKR